MAAIATWDQLKASRPQEFQLAAGRRREGEFGPPDRLHLQGKVKYELVHAPHNENRSNKKFDLADQYSAPLIRATKGQSPLDSCVRVAPHDTCGAGARTASDRRQTGSFLFSHVPEHRLSTCIPKRKYPRFTFLRYMPGPQPPEPHATVRRLIRY